VAQVTASGYINLRDNGQAMVKSRSDLVKELRVALRYYGANRQENPG
jgi:hypothetical protein